MTEPLGRLIPTLPRWTTHEREGRKSTRVKPHVQSGLRFVGGAKCWCYLCHSEHPWGAECGAPVVAVRTRITITEPVPCTFCGTQFMPSPFTRGTNRFCSPACRAAIKRAKARVGYDGRYD